MKMLVLSDYFPELNQSKSVDYLTWEDEAKRLKALPLGTRALLLNARTVRE